MSDDGTEAAETAASGENDDAMSTSAGEPRRTVPGLGRAIAVYTAIRLGLIVVLTVVLALAGAPFGMPPIIALMFAIIVQFPLAVLFFRGPRDDLTAALARAKSHRTAERDRLRAELTGTEPPD